MHTNDFSAYFFTIVGAVIGDSWLGAYKSIACMMIVYSIGNAVVAVAAIESLNLPILAFTFIGLITIAIGVRPNLNAFAGIQYKLPEPLEELKFFFSIQYFLMKCGSLTACFLTPMLCADVKCFGKEDCYPLAFGIPAISIVCSFVIFMNGTPLYVQKPPSGNMLIKVIACISKSKQRQKNSKSHWLDYSVEKYGQKLVKDTKTILNVLVMFLPMPIYWSGQLLQNSRWVFQAARMNGDVGWFVIKPEQITVDSEDLVEACRTPPRARSPSIHRLEIRPSDIQHLLGDCVNAIAKWHYRPSRERDTGSLTNLLCGEDGLVKCMQNAFLCGFKSQRLFGRNLYIWDYFVKVKECFEAYLIEETVEVVARESVPNCSSSPEVQYVNSPNSNPQTRQELGAIYRCFVHLMDEINNVTHTLGKDGKLQLFICLSLREHLLHRMLAPMAASRTTQEIYDEQSFMRKKGLLTFLRQIIEPLDEFHIVLENSITQGIPPHC